MDTKKDIGASIKHKLESFKDTPDDFVWANIEGQLKKKKKKRALLYWLSGTGLGLLVLILWLINPMHPNIETHTTETKINSVSHPNSTQVSKDSNTLDSNNEHSKVTEISDTNTMDDTPSEDVNQQLVKQASTSETSEHSNIKKTPQQITNRNKNLNTTQNNKTQIVRSKISETPKTAPNTKIAIEQPNNDTAKNIKNEKRSARAIAIAKRDSLIAANKKIRDSLKEQQHSKRLVSEEKTKDSIIEDDQSRWSITPQATLSYYGAFNTKTSDNLSFNYGVLASYRMTEDTYLRIGLRRLRLNQTIDQTERIVEYLEFPLEIKYVPFNSKFKPYLTSGLSYFKLQSMELSNTDNFEYKATMGINLGLGLETKLFNHIYYNLETNFNYQLKPFTQKNNVSPFIVSIHTGIEYRF